MDCLSEVATSPTQTPMQMINSQRSRSNRV